MRSTSLVSACTVVVLAIGVSTVPTSGRAQSAAGRQASPPPARGAAPLKPLTDAASLAQGRTLYESPDYMCQNCHKPDLGGLIGPNLVDDFWAHGCSVTEVVASIEKGFPATGMLPFGSNKPMTSLQAQQMASYILSKRGSNPPGAKPQDPTREKVCK